MSWKKIPLLWICSFPHSVPTLDISGTQVCRLLTNEFKKESRGMGPLVPPGSYRISVQLLLITLISISIRGLYVAYQREGGGSCYGSYPLRAGAVGTNMQLTAFYNKNKGITDIDTKFVIHAPKSIRII